MKLFRQCLPSKRENGTLSRLLADAELEKVALKEIAKGTF